MAVYLDYNATCQQRPQSIAAMQEWLAIPANPSSAHSYGRAAKKQLEDARKIIAEKISAWPNEIIFMASGTEANVTALRGFPERRLLVSAIEHSSVLKHTCNDNIVKVDSNGVVNFYDLEKKLAASEQTALVSVMLANNETGVIQPISAIAELCKKHGALLHCDAVQALGKMPVDFSLLGADMLSISAHKCGGPLGAAALVIKNNLSIKPLLTGGGQELGRRAGTENIAAIAGFASTIEAIDLNSMKTLRGYMDIMETKMQSAGGIIFGKDVPRLPNTTCVAMNSVSSETQLIDFDLNGYAVSAGSACSSGRIEKSHVLLAMGVDSALAGCTIRISTGWNTTPDEIEKFTDAWMKLAVRLRK